MTDQWPALVVTTGQQAGAYFPVRTGRLTIGRDPQADIRITSAVVGRHHAVIRREGTDLVVEDLGSLNGTYLNGARLEGTGVLRPDDTLRLADVDLLYVLPKAHPPTPGPAPASSSQAYGDVDGSVNTGNPVNQGGSQIIGSGSIYQGPVHHGDRIDLEVGDDPWQELFSGRGPGRVLMAIGLVATVTGFAIWMSVIFSGMGSIGPDVTDFTSPFERQILGINAAVLGFSLFGGGGLLAGIGAGMSKAARKREDRRDG